MLDLNRQDVRHLVRRLPPELREALKNTPGMFVAGGFIRSVIAGEKVNDIDCFVGGLDRSRREATAINLLMDPPVGIVETENAITLKSKPAIQFIHRWTFSSPKKGIDSFDFTIAKAAIWYDGEWKSVCDDRFYEDLAAKRLVYCEPVRDEEAGGSLLRVLKFTRRGYRIGVDGLAKVIARLTAAVPGPLCAEDLEAQLRMVDPDVDPDHEAHLPVEDR